MVTFQNLENTAGFSRLTLRVVENSEFSRQLAIALLAMYYPQRGDAMALVAIKTASTTGYCDCICGCYELASLRDEENGKGYCPRCGKEHLELNQGIGMPMPAPSKRESSHGTPSTSPYVPEPADPPGRLR